MGAAKTRLARDIGPTHAQRHARAMTARVLRQTADPRWEREVWVSPDRAAGYLPTAPGVLAFGQGGGDLSRRLLRVMARPGPVAVVGTDAPALSGRDVAEAFAALRGAELVLGPAADGGFWLIAARGPVRPGLFAGVRWSGAQTRADVEANVSGRVAHLRTLTDADDRASLRRAFAEARAGRARHPS